MVDAHWYLRVLKTGIEPGYEANTSRYVHEVLLRCLGWPMELILPQVSRRGFIDYKLVFPHGNVGVHVEVKRFGAPLQDVQIRKYLVRRGPSCENMRVGVLTNLREWRIYAAGFRIRRVSGAPMVQVKRIIIRRRADIAALEDLIGFRNHGRCTQMRAALGESPAVLRHLMIEDPAVRTAIREQLNGRADTLTPQHTRLKELIHAILNGESMPEGDDAGRGLRRALRSRLVAEKANTRLVALVGSRNRVGRMRMAIKELLAAPPRQAAA